MSSEVKRYDAFDGYGSAMPGKFIRESDYAALEAENARLKAEVEELDALRKRQSELLSAAAIAIRGPEPALTRYSHADIPERVKMVVADRDAARAQLAPIQQAKGEAVMLLQEANSQLHTGDLPSELLDRIDAFLATTTAPQNPASDPS